MKDPEGNMQRVKPAVSLVAVPGRRQTTLDLAQRLEREGFTGIYCPSPGDGLALCQQLALVTREIALGTSIAHIYTRHPLEYAQGAVMRKTLVSYTKLPNYQNYWIEAGYEDEMRAIREAIGKRDDDAIQRAMSDRWLGDVTLFGPTKDVRDGVEAWRAAGVKTVILVPSSTRGGQIAAFEELITAYR